MRRSSRAHVVAGVAAAAVALARPTAPPLSPVAQLGRDLFFDTTLSASGHESCASCHAPARAYASDEGMRSTRGQGARAVPSLRYLDRTPAFRIGPPLGDPDEPVAASAASGTPRGGLFWDGRAPTLQSQAMAPLFNPAEMANKSVESLATRVRRVYGARLAGLFGAETVVPPDRLVAEVTFAIGRFELEDSSFHPYDSKYDAYLAQKATLTAEEARGLALFENTAKGNCAACHVDRPRSDGRPPTFTDYEYEALGVPRNRALVANRDPRFFDLGLCGPARAELAAQSRLCGMFRTPSLRNVATRPAFFHNGDAHSLDDVLAFYAFRAARPQRVYPTRSDGSVARFDDLPREYRANVDTVDPPFNRKRGDPPALTDREMHDIIAFLKTLTDGYRAP